MFTCLLLPKLMFLRTYKHFIVFKYHVNNYSYMRTNFHEYVITRTHICSFYHCIIEHTFEIFAKICCKNQTYVFLRTHYMSVYSYVALKVHTNVRKVGTHLNVWYIERMFAESTRVCFLIRTSVLYIMNISLPRPFSTFLFHSLLYYIRKHSFPHILYLLPRHFLSAPLFTFIYLYYTYSI